MMGKVDRYRGVLQKFRGQFADAPDQIRSALAAEDLPLATRLAHTLKGSAGMIGAQALQESAAALEAACRDADATTPIAEALSAMENDLAQALSALALLDDR